MAYLPVSAFQRPLTHADVQRAELASCAHARPQSVNKWSLFRALVKGQDRFGVNARDLALLQGLLTFYPHDELQEGADMILFPSNRAICERMNGMPDSTMRRHLRRLLAAGLLLRRDSHNGKRFSVTYEGEQQAFGFDLSPLLRLSAEISTAAAEQEAAQQRLRRLRLEVQLMRRDIFALLPLLGEDQAQTAQLFWDQATKTLRRKLSLEALQSLHAEHEAYLQHLKTSLLNSADVQNEQHIHNSKKENYESEEMASDPKTPAQSQAIALETVLHACPEIKTYSDRPLTSWSAFIEATYQIYQAIGISASGYREALKVLGAEQTAIIIAALLQRFDRIRSPGAYLRVLVSKAALGKFTVLPMIRAMMPQC